MIRPREFSAEYPPCPESVRPARQMVTQVLGGWPSADGAVLAASELAANAVRWSGMGTYLVRAVVTPVTCAVGYVADRGGRGGRPAAADLEGGRGLQIVAAIAQAWGIARPGVGTWTGGAAGEPRAAAELARKLGGTCTWFRTGMEAAAGAPPAEATPDGTWLAVMERSGWRCECTGLCGRNHVYPAEHAPGSPLHAVPVWPGISEASAARLPAAALAALCMDCHIGGMADGPLPALPANSQICAPTRASTA